MAVQSKMMSLGTKAPDFELTDAVSGRTVSIGDFSGKSGLLVMFICNHCPYVQHVRDELARLGRDYQDSDLAIVAISSNDIEAYPSDSPEAMKTEAETYGYVFPPFRVAQIRAKRAEHAAIDAYVGRVEVRVDVVVGEVAVLPIADEVGQLAHLRQRHIRPFQHKPILERKPLSGLDLLANGFQQR
jgi:thiol-disulfide isomerase/thioredoxin